jgi:hypothetical protein
VDDTPKRFLPHALHDTEPPEEATKPSNPHPPEQIRAPTDVGRPLESLLGEALQRAMDQTSPALAHTPEGKTPTGEAHGRPPDRPNPQARGSTVWEPVSNDPKALVRVHQAQMPILDKGARTRPDPWPNLGIVIVNPNSCRGSASQLEGEQNFHVPCVGSELHAAPPTPQNFSSPFSPFPSLPDTLILENPSRGQDAATERCTTKDLRPERLKPPDAQAEDLHESGGVSSKPGDSPVFPEDVDPFGRAGVAENTDAGEVETSSVDAHERGGALPVAGTAPALAKGTAGVKPAGEAERAITAKSEALAPRTQGMARREVERPPREGKRMRERNPEALSREREHVKALPSKHKRECGTTPQGNPNEGNGKPSWPSRAPSHKDVMSASEGPAIRPGPWDPGGIVARKTKQEPGRSKYQLGGTITRNQPRTLGHTPPAVSYPFHRGVDLFSFFEARREGAESSWSWETSRPQRPFNKAAVWWPSHPHPRHTSSRASAFHIHALAQQGNLNARPQPQNKTCAPPFLHRRHFTAVRRLSAK